MKPNFNDIRTSRFDNLYHELIFLNADISLDKMALTSFKYANDYTGNWTDRSLLSPGYIDTGFRRESGFIINNDTGWTTTSETS
jgi:hypothetical protein